MAEELLKPNNSSDLLTVKKLEGIGDIIFEKAAEAHFLLENGIVIRTNRHARRVFNPKSEEWFGFDPFNEEDGIFRYLPDEKVCFKPS